MADSSFRTTTEVTSVRAKGLAIMGAVSALKPAHERNAGLVPESLRRYLEQTIDIDGWYPLDDYLALLKVLASTLDPAKAKGDLFRAFGVIGAQRDVRGVQPNVPQEMRPDVVGSYKAALGGVTGLATLVRRALHLRERYYSRGYYKVRRGGERLLLITLHDFPARAELCSLSTGYLTEIFRSTVKGSWVERKACRAGGDPECRWELRFDETIDVGDLAAFD